MSEFFTDPLDGQVYDREHHLADLIKMLAVIEDLEKQREVLTNDFLIKADDLIAENRRLKANLANRKSIMQRIISKVYRNVPTIQ